MSAAQRFADDRPEILVVEPSVAGSRSLLEIVRGFGYPVRKCPDASAAWRSLVETPAPIVLTAGCLPEGSGIRLSRRIRATSLDSYVYLLVVTPAEASGSPYRALEAGADVQLSAPVDAERLRWALRGGERIIELERALRAANAKLRETNSRLGRVARVDPLMQIGNRLAFEDKIREVHEWAAAKDRFYAVVMCDLDHFKCYNDTLGHRQGDEILRRVAEAVEEAIRDSDHAFRYGGEEIALLLIDQDLEEAANIAERVRAAVEEVEFNVDDGALPFRVTISCGVSAYPENCSPECDWRLIVEGADQALYIAKGSGRNRVAVMNGPGLRVATNSGSSRVVEAAGSDGAARLLRPVSR